MRRRRWLFSLGCGCSAVVLTLAAVVVGVVVRANETCTVGIAGTDLQVIAQGGGSQAFCQSFISSNGAGGYYRQPDDTATLICRVHVGGVWFVNGAIITVRDRGVFNAYGSAECAQLPGGTQPGPQPGS